MLVLRRMLLPLGLLVACVAAWITADNLGDLSLEPAQAGPVETLDTSIASVRRVPAIATTSLRSQRIELAVEALPEPFTPLSCFTVLVDGAVVADVRGDAPLVPGYAQLLATAHTALEVLGPDYRFETQAMAADPPTEDGVIGGSLYLVGGGDPVFMSFSYAQSFRPVLSTRTLVEDLADAVVAAGVTEVRTSIVGIERRYDRERGLPGWPASVFETGVVGPLSALQLDDGLAERAAANGGVAVPSDDPAALAAARFDDLLEDRGVSIQGLARGDTEDESLPDLVPIASVRSAPLSDIVFQMLAVNDASAAEMLMKEIGVAFQQTGSTRAGAEAVRLRLGELGVDLSVAPRDGASLDPVSTSTCSTLARTAAAIPADHPTMIAAPSYNLPGVYDGEFGDVDIAADLRLVGGTRGDVASFVARTVDAGPQVVISSIVNRSGGTLPPDRGFHRELVQSVDGLRLAWAEYSIDD